MTKYTIRSWRDASHVLAEVEADSFRAALEQQVCNGANLGGADLGGANLGGADLYDANLRGADLRDANLYGADLRDANLRGANLHGADLHGANLHGANLHGAKLHGANLHGAKLRGANLHGANLHGANLHGAKLRGAKINWNDPEQVAWVLRARADADKRHPDFVLRRALAALARDTYDIGCWRDRLRFLAPLFAARPGLDAWAAQAIKAAMHEDDNVPDELQAALRRIGVA